MKEVNEREYDGDRRSDVRPLGVVESLLKAACLNEQATQPPSSSKITLSYTNIKILSTFITNCSADDNNGSKHLTSSMFNILLHVHTTLANLKKRCSKLPAPFFLWFHHI